MSDDGSRARRFVDMWLLPSMHPTNIELLQKLKSADDRQFGTDMDVVGTVSMEDPETGDWTKSHLVGIRSDLWSPNEQELERSLRSLQKDRKDQLREQIKRRGRLNKRQQSELELRIAEDPLMQLEADHLETRRLVLKLFRTTSTRMRWEGTIEELTADEVHNTMGSRRPLLSFAVILQGHEYLSTVQQNHRTFRIPSLYTFCYFDERLERLWHITIKRRWVSIGADFTIEAGGHRIGKIDGHLISFGYNAYVTLRDHPLAENSEFMDLLTLFATSVGYHRTIRRTIQRRVKAVQSDLTQRHIVEDEEMWLRKNPRRFAA